MKHVFGAACLAAAGLAAGSVGGMTAHAQTPRTTVQNGTCTVALTTSNFDFYGQGKSRSTNQGRTSYATCTGRGNPIGRVFTASVDCGNGYTDGHLLIESDGTFSLSCRARPGTSTQ